MNPEASRILVPLDGSREAEAILGTIMPLVRDHPTEVHLLQVIPDSTGATGATAYLARASEALAAHAVRTVHELALGQAAAGILSYLRDTRCDLVAMSTHGRTGVNRLRFGSVTESVLRHAEVPLLVCRPGTAVPSGRSILVALDGSPRGEAVLPDAVRLARALGAGIDVVHAAIPYLAAGGYGDFPMTYSHDDPIPYARDVCARLASQGVDARPITGIGGAAALILSCAKESQARLLCLTTHGRTGLARLLLGSVAEEVLRHAPCPVLVRRSTSLPAGE